MAGDNIYVSYDQVGAKEDVSDVISNISPTKTPFQTAIGAEKVHNKVFDWQEDTLRAVQDNNQAEGFTAAPVSATPTSLRENVTQIMAEAIKVAATTDAISAYGRARESALQISKTAAQLKRDLENALVGTAQAKVKPADNTTNRKMAGYQAQCDASNLTLTNGALTETAVLATLQAIYNNGGDPTAIHVTPSNSMIVAAFASASGRSRQNVSTASMQDQKTVVNVVDLYITPFGTQRITLNRFQAVKNTLIFDPDMWSKVTLRPWTRETLAKTGDSTPMMIVGEFSLKHKNFKASGGVSEFATNWLV
jgi:hypothetical protein